MNVGPIYPLQFRCHPSAPHLKHEASCIRRNHTQVSSYCRPIPHLFSSELQYFSTIHNHNASRVSLCLRTSRLTWPHTQLPPLQQCTMFSCTKRPISQWLGILMYYGMVNPLASLRFAQRDLAYDHKTVPHTNPTTKIAVWQNKMVNQLSSLNLQEKNFKC